VWGIRRNRAADQHGAPLGPVAAAVGRACAGLAATLDGQPLAVRKMVLELTTGAALGRQSGAPAIFAGRRGGSALRVRWSVERPTTTNQTRYAP
jgi:hypothetical protein